MDYLHYEQFLKVDTLIYFKSFNISEVKGFGKSKVILRF